MRDGGEPGRTRHLLDDLSDHLGSERWVRRDGLLGVNRVVAVKAEDGVEVDEAAFLELGDLGIGKLHPCAVNLCEFVQAAADGDGGAPPQLGGVGVPHDGR